MMVNHTREYTREELCEALDDAEVLATEAGPMGPSVTYLLRDVEVCYRITLDHHVEDGIQFCGQTMTAERVEPREKIVTVWVPFGSPRGEDIHAGARANEREAICDILASAEPNTRAEWAIGVISARMEKRPNDVPPEMAGLISAWLEATADELADLQKEIRKRGTP